MDLANLKPTKDTVEVEILHPTTFEPLTNEDGSEMTITVLAPHSKEYKAILHEQTNKRLKQAQKTKRLDVTAEELEDATIDLLAKSTVSWDITYAGEKPKLTLGKAKEIYTEVFWIRAQIEEAVSNSLDFTTA